MKPALATCCVAGQGSPDAPCPSCYLHPGCCSAGTLRARPLQGPKHRWGLWGAPGGGGSSQDEYSASRAKFLRPPHGARRCLGTSRQWRRRPLRTEGVRPASTPRASADKSDGPVVQHNYIPIPHVLHCGSGKCIQ